MHFLDLTLGIRFEPVLGGLGQFLSGGGGGVAGSEVCNRVYMIAPVKNLTEWDWTLKLG